VSAGDERTISRRGLLKTTGATAGAAATGSFALGNDDLSPVGNAEAIPTVVVLGTGVVVGAAIVHLSKQKEGPDREKIENTVAAQTHYQLYTRAKKDWEVREQNVLGSMTNDARFLRSKAREDAVFKIFEAAASGLSKSTAQSRARTAMDKVYAQPQENLITRTNAYFNGGVTTALNLDGPVDVGEFKNTSQNAWVNPNDTVQSRNATLLDGRNVSASGMGYSGEPLSYATYWKPESDVNSQAFLNTKFRITEFRPSDYGQDESNYDMSIINGSQKWLDFEKYRNVWEKLESEHSTMILEIDSLLDTHYQAIKDGDVTIEDLLGPSSMMDTVEQADSWQEAALLFNGTGIPTGTEPVDVSIPVPDSLASEKDTIELRGMLAWSLANEQGNELPVGEEIDPENRAGSIYFATQFSDENGEMTGENLELIEPFTILRTKNKSDKLTFEKRNVVDPDTSPSEAIDILSAISDANKQAREATKDTWAGSSSGSNWSIPKFGLGSIAGIPTWIIAAVGGVVGLNQLNN